MEDQQQATMFASLPEGERRWRSLACGYASQLLIAVSVSIILASAPTIAKKSYETIELVPPTSAPDQIKERPRETIRPPAITRVIPRKVEDVQAPNLIRKDVPQIQIAMAQPQPVLAMHVETGRFSPATTPNNVAPTKQEAHVVQSAAFGLNHSNNVIAASIAKVRTGGFGDPNGFVPNAAGSDNKKLATIGAFQGGTGSSGVEQARVAGKVVNGAFGSGAATSNQGSSTTGRLQLASFATATATGNTVQRTTAKAPEPTTVPVQIQSKPKPVYSAEARQLRIEGEVLVQVVFSANGNVKVLRMMHGLGHGLDEAAIAAAESIRFTPAQRNGQPVDSTATLHIVFQLS